MAPGRKRGANRGKLKNQLSLGDLVLAKVKGFPAWPAKISRPEDWDRTSDPKKYFVQFFGTSEIAFVAPGDIQEFTNESKSKLSARCQGKTEKDFTRAVKEICEAFEELHGKNSGECREETETAAADMVSLVGGGGDELKDKIDIIEMKGVDNQALGDEMGGLERCSHRQNEISNEDINHGNLSDDKHLSPVVAVSEINSCNDGAQSTKKEVSLSKLDKASPLSDGVGGDRGRDCKEICPDFNKAEFVSKSLISGRKKHDHNEGDAPSGDEKDESPLLPLSTQSKQLSGGKKVVSNGQKSMKVVGKSAFSDSIKVSSSDISEPPTDTGNGRKGKSFVKSEKLLKAGDKACDVQDPRKDLLGNTGKLGKKEPLVCEDQRNKKSQNIDRKHGLVTNEDSRPGKRLKREPAGTVTTKNSILKTGKNDSLCSDAAVDNKTDKLVEGKKVPSRLGNENRSASQLTGCTAETDLIGDGTVLPQAKRRRQVLEASSDCVTQADKKLKEKSWDSRKTESSKSGHGRFLVNHGHTRRRAVLRFDDDDDDECTTPVHGESQNNSKHGGSTHAQKNNVDRIVDNIDSTQSCASKDRTANIKTESISPNPSQSEPKRPKKTNAAQLSHSPGKFEPISEEELPASELPQASLGLLTADKPAEHKTTNTKSRSSGIAAPKKIQTGIVKGSGMDSNSTMHSHNQVATQKNRPTVSAEKSKVTPKLDLPTTDAFTEHYFAESDRLLLEGLEAGRDDKITSLSMDTKFDSVSSMKHLIAAAQAKRREAHSQSLSQENCTSASISAVHPVQGSISPDSANQSFPFSTSIAMQQDAKGPVAQTSPSSHVHQFKLEQVDQEECEEGKTSSGYHARCGSLSGGTEAVVARDAFEGMIETLSRTKDSIGRATRLAIDCAKYGIASEVVELLIRKLETEASYHRRVDLFFLVDSITQCSHSQKGIAGASYIPTVQAALPRLLGAAAPPGAGARENRRQCHKVLRLWLERKILPESLLRRYMDDIGVSNDDMNGFFLRRPSRAERAIDDPIREMEGILVDEYGSNATFQLPGLLSSHVLDDEDDLSDSLCNGSGDESAVDTVHAPDETEASAVTPADRRHRILEDVDGELEMEDVSGSTRDEKPSDPFKVDPHRRTPGPLSSLGPPHSLLPQQSLPSQLPITPQPLMPSHQVMPPQLSLPSSSTPLGYQPPMHQEYCRTSSGNQLLQITGSTSHPGHIPAASVNKEMFLAPSSSLVPAGLSNTHDPSGFTSFRPSDYGHNEMYLHNSQPSQQFQAGNTPFAQRPYHQVPPAQTPTSYHAYNKPSAQHHMQQPFPHPYSLPSFPNARRPFVVDEQWKMPSNDLNPDNQHPGWLGGGRPPCSRPPFVQEGFFRHPIERPPTNPMGFQLTVPNPHASGAPMPAPGHGVGHALPCTPDMAGVPPQRLWTSKCGGVEPDRSEGGEKNKSEEVEMGANEGQWKGRRWGRVVRCLNFEAHIDNLRLYSDPTEMAVEGSKCRDGVEKEVEDLIEFGEEMGG
ncbi:Enhancer of ag-4 protein [Thalictrum thalictroides]|uniref:Enhancer of ag-4 protein n=1 Tax=Thalictrum thalictroides TaxID=46969 RepID=A0A7J6UZ00_THATH|nr:Enhancer of ag-4 protein [Thalictrum thalictroides]